FGGIVLLSLNLHDGVIQERLGARGIELDRRLHLLHGGGEISLASFEVRQRHVDIGVAGLLGGENVQLLLSFLEEFGGNQHIRDVDTSRVIVGLYFDGAVKFLIPAIDFAESKISQSEMIVSIGKARVHQDRVAVLNGGFAKLVLFEEALAALKIFLLADVR